MVLSLFPKFYYSALRPLSPGYRRLRFNNMSAEIPESKSPITVNEKVKKFQHVFHSNSTNSWDKRWEEDLTPWDLGSPTPVLVHLHDTGSLPKGRALVPGCGSGYDVVAIACTERHVVGMDISDNAIKKAIERVRARLGASPRRGATLGLFLLPGARTYRRRGEAWRGAPRRA